MSIVSLETGGLLTSSLFDNPAPYRINEQMSAEFLVALYKFEAAASDPGLEGAHSHGCDRELITCRYEASL